MSARTCALCEEDFHDRCTNLACLVGFYNVLSTTPNEIAADTPDPLEERLSRKYTVGQAVGIETVVRKIRERAASAFMVHDDKRATALRDMADEFEKIAKTLRKE